jgi:peptidylprolyl isomerase
MPTDKRARQKAGRVSRLTEQRAAELKDVRRRKFLRVGAAVVAVLAFAFVVSWLNRDKSGKVATGATTTTLPGTTVTSASTTTTYSDPALATEVLARKRPDPVPPPANLAKDKVVVKSSIEGTGRVIALTDTLTMNYVGSLSDGTVFDESWAKGQPLNYPLSQLIKGWQEGLVGLKVGARVHLDIGSDKAYGPTGQGSIPADAPLAFEIDIIDAVPGA